MCLEETQKLNLRAQFLGNRYPSGVTGTLSHSSHLCPISTCTKHIYHDIVADKEGERGKLFAIKPLVLVCRRALSQLCPT